MVHTPDSVSCPFPDSPTTPAAPIKDEFRHPSLNAVSSAPSAEHEASAQGRKGSKKPRSVVNMTQDQRNRKRENGKISSSSPLYGYATSIPAECGKARPCQHLFPGRPLAPLELVLRHAHGSRYKATCVPFNTVVVTLV